MNVRQNREFVDLVKLAGIGFVVAAVLFILLARGCYQNYSTGQRAGTITKFSERGLIWKSNEGQMILGGIVQKPHGKAGTIATANVWDFSVTNEDVRSSILKAQESGATVNLHYRQWMIGPVWLDTSYVIESVEVVE